MFGRTLARSADVARARLHALGAGWVPTQRDVDEAFSDPPPPAPSASVTVEAGERMPLMPLDPPRRRVRIQSEAARGMLVLAAVGIVGALTLLLLNWPRGESAPDVVQPPAIAGTAGSATPGALASGAAALATAASGVVVVDVAGEVRRPGVRELPAGARVIDAIDAAGGVTRRADTSALNLARVLADGEQVLVAAKASQASSPSGAVPSVVPSGGVAGAASVSINSGTLDQLDALPGIGPVLAQAIIDYRTQNGPFVSLEQLMDVSGIGDATFADLAGLVTL